ncbi:MAG: DNA mismatch repair protein MutS [Candidatus Latescibacteria bacterium]|nr:DNA mismatch repair protein MutS [Candidatus Latescibacterota bacterium]
MTKITPMIAQYHQLKRQYPDAILFFRMGDFYEMFFEDAKIGSRVLGLTLTSRNHSKGEEVPLAGLPYHALDNYLPKMVRAGYKVAICEQMEDPKKAKGLVKRDVVEVVSPGTVLSEGLLEGKTNNFLAAVAKEASAERVGICLTDVSTGAFQVTEVSEEALWDELGRSNPSEVVVSEAWAKAFEPEFARRFPGVTLTKAQAWTFHYDTAYELLTEHFKVTSLKGFGCEELTQGICAAGAALRYLVTNQKRALPHIHRMTRVVSSEYMVLDAATARNLELTASMQGGREGTLLGLLDRTLTPMGARLLRRWLSKPLRSVARIEARLDAVEELTKRSRLMEDLSARLGDVGDVERTMVRICCGRANARDLMGLRRSLEAVPGLREVLADVSAGLLKQCAEDLVDVSDVTLLIEKAIVEDPPLSISDGGLIRAGYDAEVDELREISTSGKGWIARLQATEQKRTGIPSLKVKYNKVFGYFIEVTKPNLNRVPEDYIRKQTLVNAERFITPALKEYEAKVLGADERIGELEYALFVKVRDQVARRTEAIQRIATGVAGLDALRSLAETAQREQYVRPKLDDGERIEIVDGRHPVVERTLKAGAFVPNDTRADTSSEQILIITGPNMSGKSTLLRQVGLIVLLAQIGSFVPAGKAHIGVVDRIFTRVGASDNLTAGESTFLVEMNEAANILHNATRKSLVLLDEIGRGTSTFDGLSLAWAITEFLHNQPDVRARTLFATHYHELVELGDVLPRVKNYNVAVRENAEGVVFLRKLAEGGCDHSYGIHVAKLAGMPKDVIDRAEEILTNLERHELDPMRLGKRISGARGSKRKAVEEQMSLFGTPREHPVVAEIRKVDVSGMTPLDALNCIARWQERLKEKSS